MKKAKSKPKKKQSKSKKPLLTKLIFRAVLLLILILIFAVVYLDVTVRERFEGKRWKLPAQVYARPLELYPGLQLSPREINNELDLLGYRQTPHPQKPGSYLWHDRILELITRDFTFADGFQQSMDLRLSFSNGHLQRITNAASNEKIQLIRLDPPLIGGIYPEQNEDRVLVKLDQVPQTVIDALIAVEDRRFYSHHGVDLKGITRALVAMAKGGQIQGGSTITQQLVKNFYLSSERTIQRKLVEMVMALLLEVHYSKEEILETYLNEVYLGQDGNRAIHGFGLASHFFFDKPVSQLELQDAALLVGMLKGPSYYNPRTQPQRARQRRNLVLQLMEEHDTISWTEASSARNQSLGVVERPIRGTSPFPAFMDLVQRQLRQNYRDEDLRSQGLKILTTLDPQVQHAAEAALQQRLSEVESSRRLKRDSLQGAILVTSSQNAEVQAIVGGRDPRFEGFNRALDAKRPIGSLIKPLVFLTALEQPDSYSLATLLDDSPLVVEQNGSADWQPQNFDKKFHDRVLLHDALVHSYNVSTARLGLELGPDAVMKSLQRLGVERSLPAYPSSLLGANALTPLEVSQVYQSIASGGFKTPLKAIREVLTSEGVTLQHYPLDVELVASSEATYLLTVAMQDVVTQGTAKGLENYLPQELGIAGKTGTTDDFRDSWFAGFSGDRLAVVWVGRDDNQSTGLTGSSGAMTIWGSMLAKLDPQPLILPEPDRIEAHWIDRPTGLLSSRGCKDAVLLPFISGSAPRESVPCRAGKETGNKNWFERIFQ